MKKKPQIPDEYWKAIVENDSSYDDSFYYGVATTGIFCRPSCKSRTPRIENVLIFKNAKMALSENFRPCKRCKPDGLRLPDAEWILQIVEWINENFNKQISLEKLAEIGHGSHYHLQRTFNRLKGMSPLEYIQQVRIEKAINYLITTNKSVSEIGIAVGLSNTPYFITLFKKKTGITPAEYRKQERRSYEQ
ncbi:bifunctional transcriptional activator/DNA repair enzyme AdaA [Neobacillus pocheonensis]|uniref:bifunctional transcriptional activator/DNA repair enzyme AdaA n=1 Tax=Neobacillus pocheonensis TaxID=363869 RepID=UPI003D2AF23E